MKKLIFIFSSQGGGGGGIGSMFSGFASIGMGMAQDWEAGEYKREGEKKYQKAWGDIPSELSPELMAMTDEITRKRKAYETGTASSAASDALGTAVSTGGYNVANVAGGGTGSTLKAILGLSEVADRSYERKLETDLGTSAQLLGLETKQVSDTQERKDKIKKMKADFNVFRGSQDMTMAASLNKASDENISGGIASIGEGFDSFSGGMMGM